MTEDEFFKNHPLPIVLPGMVEVAMLDVRNWSPDRRIEYARAHAETFASTSDTLLFGSKTKGEAGALAGKLATVIACMSFQPGGVRVFGCHWKSFDSDSGEIIPASSLVEPSSDDFATLFPTAQEP